MENNENVNCANEKSCYWVVYKLGVGGRVGIEIVGIGMFNDYYYC